MRARPIAEVLAITSEDLFRYAGTIRDHDSSALLDENRRLASKSVGEIGLLTSIVNRVLFGPSRMPGPGLLATFLAILAIYSHPTRYVGAYTAAFRTAVHLDSAVSMSTAIRNIDLISFRAKSNEKEQDSGSDPVAEAVRQRVYEWIGRQDYVAAEALLRLEGEARERSWRLQSNYVLCLLMLNRLEEAGIEAHELIERFGLSSPMAKAAGYDALIDVELARQPLGRSDRSRLQSLLELASAGLDAAPDRLALVMKSVLLNVALGETAEASALLVRADRLSSRAVDMIQSSLERDPELGALVQKDPVFARILEEAVRHR